MKWKGHNKGGAFAGLTPGSNGTAMPVGDPAANGESDTGTFIFRAAVQPLEDSKNFLQMLLIETNAVICDGNLTHGILRWRSTIFVIGRLLPGSDGNCSAGYPDNRLGALRLKFQGVAQEVL